MKQPLPLDGLILLNLRLADLHTRIWFGIAPHLADDTLLGITFIDRFIRGIFPSEHNVIPWHSKPVAIMARTQLSKIERISQLVLDDPVSAAYLQVHDDPSHYVVRVARQDVLQPYSLHHVLLNTNSHALFSIEPRALSIGRQNTLAARGVMEVSPWQSFHILVSNFSNWQVHLPKLTIIAQTAEPSSAINVVDQKAFPIVTPEVDANPPVNFTQILANMLLVCTTRLHLAATHK